MIIRNTYIVTNLRKNMLTRRSEYQLTPTDRTSLGIDISKWDGKSWLNDIDNLPIWVKLNRGDKKDGFDLTPIRKELLI
jgi:hypothetical protein